MIKKDQKYRIKQDMVLPAIITYGAPCSGYFEGLLKKGDVITVENNPPRGAKGVYARPDRYEEIELEFVPDSVRKDPEYSDFAFTISLKDISKHFEKLK